MTSTGAALIDLCLGLRVADSLDGPGVDDLARRACELRLESQLLHRLGSSGSSGELARRLADDLGRRVQETSIRNFYVDRALDEVWQRFAAAGIETIHLKGSARRLTRPASCGRTQLDVDVLVRRRDVDRAEAVLVECGFRPGFDPNDRGKWVEDHFHLSFRRDSVLVELHWNLDNPSPEGFMDRFWSASRTIDVGPRRYRVPSPGHALLQDCVHLSRHRFGRGLRWLADLALEMPPPEAAWRDFLAEAASWPARVVFLPLWFLARLDVHGAPRIDDTRIHARASDPALLVAVLSRRLVGESWAGLPGWRVERALGRWLDSRKALAGCLFASVVGRVPPAARCNAAAW